MANPPSIEQMSEILGNQVLVGRACLTIAQGIWDADPVVRATAPTFFGLTMEANLLAKAGRREQLPWSQHSSGIPTSARRLIRPVPLTLGEPPTASKVARYRQNLDPAMASQSNLPKTQSEMDVASISAV